MTLAANENLSGGFVRDPYGRLVTVTETAGAALGATEAYSGGFVRDGDGRLLIYSSAGGVLTATEQISGGFVRDALGRLGVVTTGAVGYSGGFQRDQAGRLVTTIDTAGPLSAAEQFSGGFVRDPNGNLVTINVGFSSGGAAPTFRSAGALVTGANSGAGINVSYPAGIAANDLLVMQVTLGSSSTLNIPSGWTRLFGPVTGSGAISAGYHFLYKLATGGESGTLLVTGTGSQALAAIMSAYSGCNTSTPIDTSATASNPTTGTTGTCPAVTTTAANRLLLHMYWDFSSSGNITQDAADTERYDSFDSVENVINELATVVQATAGASAANTATFSTATSGGLSATVALSGP